MKKKELTIPEMVRLLKKKKSISGAKRKQIIRWLKQLEEIKTRQSIISFWNASAQIHGGHKA